MRFSLNLSTLSGVRSGRPVGELLRFATAAGSDGEPHHFDFPLHAHRLSGGEQCGRDDRHAILSTIRMGARVDDDEVDDVVGQ